MTDCTTAMCGIPGTVSGIWGSSTLLPHRVTYCQACAVRLAFDGSFIPDDDADLKTPELTRAQKDILAKFDAAPPAPESFDAVAAVRRVVAVIERLEEPVFRPAITLPDYQAGRTDGEAFERALIAVQLRAAVRGDDA